VTASDRHEGWNRDASTAPGRSAIRNPDAEGLPYLPAGHEGAPSPRSGVQGRPDLGSHCCQRAGVATPPALVP
jgi:hypothetical protein